MAQTIPNPEPAGGRTAPHLDCERLDCYWVAVEFQTIAARLVSNRRVEALREQLDRSPATHPDGAHRVGPRAAAALLRRDTMAGGS